MRTTSVLEIPYDLVPVWLSGMVLLSETFRLVGENAVVAMDMPSIMATTTNRFSTSIWKFTPSISYDRGIFHKTYRLEANQNLQLATERIIAAALLHVVTSIA